jgi:hypothetical protein
MVSSRGHRKRDFPQAHGASRAKLSGIARFLLAVHGSNRDRQPKGLRFFDHRGRKRMCGGKKRARQLLQARSPS